MSAEDLVSAPAFRLSDLIRHGAEPPPLARLTRLPFYPWLIVSVTCIGGFMGQVDASTVQLALPTLGRVFDSTLESVSWVALAYLLGVAAFMPIFAQLCQIFGRKLLYIIGFVVFTGASALCGFAPDLPTLIAFRFLQGFGGAMLGANSMALVVTSTDKSLRAGARRLRGRASCRRQRRPGYRRPALGDIGLALGVLDQCPLRAACRGRQLVCASSHSGAESGPKVRLARRSPARARVDVRCARAQSDFSLGANLASASWFGRGRDRAYFSVPQA
jgi:hypothetical protein